MTNMALMTSAAATRRAETLPICTVSDLRAIESSVGTVTPTLMERAGAAAARLAAQLAGDSAKGILVLAGPGNNGGDAFEAAALLKARFFRVALVAEGDPAALPEGAARARRKWLDAGGEIHTEPPTGPWSLVVDGLLGIGLSREPTDRIARLIDYANAQHCPVLALDVPSGLNAQTGAVLGRAVRASHTLSFIALKPGLLTLDGQDYCGEVGVDALGLEVAALAPGCGWVASPARFRGWLRARPRNFHKGQAGSLAIIGGATGMSGAALLAGRAALKLGAGRVYVGLLEQNAPGMDLLMPELMLRQPDEVLGLDLDAIAVGPGLGQSERAEALLAAAIASELPCVLDADALNLLAENRDLRQACARRSAHTLATPHPAEAARLLGTTVSEVQHDRLAAARHLAQELGAHVVLKGAGSMLWSGPDHWYVNRSGNPGMASAGMGDVLTGILGALLAAGIPGEPALVLGVHLHGAAADTLADSGAGPIGLTAGELPDAARRIWNALIRPAREQDSGQI